MRDRLPDHARIVLTNYNPLWAPIFALGARLGLSRRRPESALYRAADVDAFLAMSGWEAARHIPGFLLPVELPLLGAAFDGIIVRLPLLDRLALNSVVIARKAQPREPRDHSVTVLVPCKNEEGNVAAVVDRMPNFGSALEIVFINDRSSDATEARIRDLQDRNPPGRIVLVQGEGRGKGRAVRSGMHHATGELCFILDADLTVIPEDLPQFYEAMTRRYADFVHGTRMLYPHEGEAMRFFNVLGNRIFAMLFSYVLGRRTTDTLCGTKVFWRRDWPAFEQMRSKLHDIDIWGDYNLIFGATYFGLKVAQLPVRYYDRLEGETKMVTRLRHATQMFRVVLVALWRIKLMV